MSWRSTLTLVVAVGAVAFTAGRVWSQDDKAGPKAPSQEEMQKAMMDAMAPAEQHKKLAATAGTWDADMTMWMEPGKDPVKNKGVSITRSVLNGLHITDEFKCDMLCMPFEGLGVMGYSKEKQRYYHLWVDTMGSSPMITWGTADKTGKIITYDGEKLASPMGDWTPRLVFTEVDADHYNFEMWAKYEGAPDFVKAMEAKYTRRK